MENKESRELKIALGSVIPKNGKNYSDFDPYPIALCAVDTVQCICLIEIINRDKIEPRTIEFIEEDYQEVGREGQTELDPGLYYFELHTWSEKTCTDWGYEHDAGVDYENPKPISLEEVMERKEDD